MSATIVESEVPVRRRRISWHALRRYPTLTAGVTLLFVLLMAFILAPVISPYSPDTQNLLHILAAPSWTHPLGTDELGRDVFSRLLWAGRTDLRVGLLAVIFPFCFGTIVGTLAGYYGGWVDTLVMRLVDVLIAFPFYVLVIVLVYIVGAGTRGIFIAFAVADWVVYARTVRSQTLIVREAEYIAAAKVGGLGDLRILLAHVLPNTISQAIVYIMSDIVLVIVAVVTLSYLGLGVQPPTPEWGTMISDGQDFITTHWTLATLPGIAVVLTGLSLSLVGDGLADLLRPQ